MRSLPALVLLLASCAPARSPQKAATVYCEHAVDDSEPARISAESADPKTVRVDDRAFHPVTAQLGMAVSTGFHRVSVATHEIEIFTAAGCTHVLRTTEVGLADDPICEPKAPARQVCSDWSTGEGARTEVMIVVAPDEIDRVADPHRVRSAHVFVDDREVPLGRPNDPHREGRFTAVGLLSVGAHAIRANLELEPLLSGGATKQASFSGNFTVPAASLHRVKLAPPPIEGSTISTRAAGIALTEW